MVYICALLHSMRGIPHGQLANGFAVFVTLPQQAVSEWVWRRRKAFALLIFGIVSGITCTDAILGAVQEEAAVVQLAQQLAAHEAVVADTTR
jgi:sodium-coupled neutral amino acid transporter 10